MSEPDAPLPALRDHLSDLDKRIVESAAKCLEQQRPHVLGIDLQRGFELLARLVELPFGGQNLAVRQVRVLVVLVERDRALRDALGILRPILLQVHVG